MELTLFHSIMVMEKQCYFYIISDLYVIIDKSVTRQNLFQPVLSV